ncbi:HAD family hydrolase [Streptomyces sp. NPDC002889]|uniref:HAD family hydrolase n=1 Tax=Streptomyces sp. NPDC002889 TaxID=3364669 RepID=UPI0036D1B0DD
MDGADGLPRRGVAAVVPDTDGVIIDSARMHAAAWKTAFDACLLAHPSEDPTSRRPFDVTDDHLRSVDGRSRLDGAASFLAPRDLELTPGGFDDPPGTGTVAAVAARKEQAFTEQLRAHGIEACAAAPRLLRTRGIPLAAVSASRHARDLLARAEVPSLFDAVVDGGEAARLGLVGTPDPALFLEATRRLGAPAARSVAVEDSPAGVEAGRRGVDRSASHGADAALLARADIVRDLAELLADDPEE